MQLGIVSLPGSGKTTIFNALTGSDRPTYAASSGKIEVHRAAVNIPDPRLDRLGEVLGASKRIATQVTYIDIGGLGGSQRGTDLSGELRNHLEKVDGFLHVVRAFEDPSVAHPLNSIDAQRDLDALDIEFVLADLARVDSRLTRIKEEMGKGNSDRSALVREQSLMERLRAELESEHLLRDVALDASELSMLRGYSLMTLKPVVVLLNIGQEQEIPSTAITYEHAHSSVLAIRGQLEMEIAQLDEEDAALFMAEYGLEESARQRTINESYEIVGLQTFFTSNEKEARAWAVRIGATALEAAGTIHSDIARGFIRAEVAHVDEVIAASGWNELKAAGKQRVEGRDYVMQDGDYMIVRFNVSATPRSP